MLVARDISYGTGNREIIKNCSLSIRPGEFTAIVGPNGAGKSTLLKALINELPHSSGKITINDLETRRLKSKPLSRMRAVMPQHTNINFPFTVEQVVEIGRFPHDTNPAEDQHIINEVIGLTKLVPFKSRTYQTLSGGEKQRVQLARIIAQVWDKTSHPKYLLLDEPTSDLDIMHQHGLLSITRDLLNQNIGVLAVLHDLNLAAHYADHMVFMKHGEIIKQGATEEIFTKENIELTFEHPVQMLKEPENGKMVAVSVPNYLKHQTQKEINYA